MSITNMQILYDLVLFLNTLNENNLIYTLKYIFKTQKIKNDYYEYHKLKLIDLIISKFTQRKSHDNFIKVIPLILDYMNTSRAVTHLMSVFSKIRLSLSLYFSLFEKIVLNKLKHISPHYLCHINLVMNNWLYLVHI